MKQYSIRITVCLAVVGCLMGASGLEKLQTRYEHQVELKIAPLRREYLKDLKDLRSELGESGDLKEAVEVDEEIQRLERSSATEPRMLVGDWVLATNPKQVFEFKKNGQCVSPWTPTKIVSWSYLEGDTIYLHLSDRTVLSLSYSHQKQAFVWPDDGSIWVHTK